MKKNKKRTSRKVQNQRLESRSTLKPSNQSKVLVDLDDIRGGRRHKVSGFKVVGVKWRMIDVSLIITLSSMERTDP